MTLKLNSITVSCAGGKVFWRSEIEGTVDTDSCEPDTLHLMWENIGERVFAAVSDLFPSVDRG